MYNSYKISKRFPGQILFVFPMELLTFSSVRWKSELYSDTSFVSLRKVLSDFVK